MDGMGVAKRKIARMILLVLAAPFIGYWLLFSCLVYSSPLTYAEMDLNHDGKVDFSEIDYAAAYGEKQIEKNGSKCVEYFAYKDGLPLKVVCPK